MEELSIIEENRNKCGELYFYTIKLMSGSLIT